MADCELPINCPTGGIVRHRTAVTFRISSIFLRTAGAAGAGAGVTGPRADGVSAVVVLMNLAICNSREHCIFTEENTEYSYT